MTSTPPEHRLEMRPGTGEMAHSSPAGPVDEPPTSDTWVALSPKPLPVAEATAWVVKPDCGASVVFSGTARDHAPGRPDVHELKYEAYEEYIEPVFARIAKQARERWPQLGRIVIWHRTGPVALTESAVVVAVSAPHRPEAFEAARYCIDTVKAAAPIWKREVGSGGESWGVADGS